IGTFEQALEESHNPAMMPSLGVAGIGILFAFTTYSWKKISADRWAERLGGLYSFLLNKWYFDELYDAVVVGGVLLLAAALRWIDETIVDGIVNGAASWTKAVVFGYSEHARDKKQSGRAFLTVGGVLSVVVALEAGQSMWSAQ